jgi:hypothetical protein
LDKKLGGRDICLHVAAKRKVIAPCWDTTPGTQRIASHQAISADSPKLKRTLYKSFFCYIFKVLSNIKRVSVLFFELWLIFERTVSECIESYGRMIGE